MKVELLVNLKVASGAIISAGSVYDDDNGPIPEFVLRRLRRGQAKIISKKSVPQPNNSVPVVTAKRLIPSAAAQMKINTPVPVPVKKVLDKKKVAFKKK